MAVMIVFRIPKASTSSRRDPGVVSRVGALILLSMVLLTASGCGVSDLVSHVKSEHFDTRTDAPTSGDLAFVLPDVIPADATDITVRVRTDDPNAKMYDWGSVSGQLPADCRQGDPTSVSAPFDPGAWPKQVLESEGLACGPKPVHVRRVSDHFYAW